MIHSEAEEQLILKVFFNQNLESRVQFNKISYNVNELVVRYPKTENSLEIRHNNKKNKIYQHTIKQWIKKNKKLHAKKIPQIYLESGMINSHEEKSFTKPNNDAKNKKFTQIQIKYSIWQYLNLPTINICCSKKKLGSYNQINLGINRIK